MLLINVHKQYLFYYPELLFLKHDFYFSIDFSFSILGCSNFSFFKYFKFNLEPPPKGNLGILGGTSNITLITFQNI